MGSTHTFLTPTIIAKEGLMRLKNNLVMGNRVHRNYEMEFPGSPKKGGTVTIEKPVKFTVTSGRTRSTSTITEQSITLSVAYQRHVSWAFNSADLALTIERYNEKYVNGATLALANRIDADVLDLYKDVFNEVWESTGFVSPETYMILGKAGQRLDEEAAPQNDRVIVFNPAAHWSMANALKNMFVTSVSEKALKRGYLATIANMEIFMDQNVKVHTNGAFHDTGSTAAILVGTTGGATGTNIELIHFRNVSTLALKQGDVFTVAGVYAVNPVSGESTGSLRQFVVTADASCAATATSAIVSAYVQPDMIDTGPYKTVDTLPAAGAAVNIVGTQGEPYPVNLAFQKNAFALVMVPLPKPHGAWGATATDEGYSIRIVKAYDIDRDDEVCRLDVLYGTKTLYPELAVRIRGAEG
jgi:hypothetical protein